jgi:tRNA(fMet)-specific endonuclease VapC
MRGKLLDSNIYIALKQSEPATVRALADDPDVFTCSVVIGELLFGAYKSQRRTENLAAVREFISHITVLPITLETAEQYGMIREELRAKGKPIPENDIWIAASALEHNLILVTNDNHFDNLSSVVRESWDSTD